MTTIKKFHVFRSLSIPTRRAVFPFKNSRTILSFPASQKPFIITVKGLQLLIVRQIQMFIFFARIILSAISY